jgi:hypothetical protein
MIYSAMVRYWRKKMENNVTVHQLLIDFRKAYDSGGGGGGEKKKILKKSNLNWHKN